jgi:hypothetical protein
MVLRALNTHRPTDPVQRCRAHLKELASGARIAPMIFLHGRY